MLTCKCGMIRKPYVWVSQSVCMTSELQRGWAMHTCWDGDMLFFVSNDARILLSIVVVPDGVSKLTLQLPTM